GFSPGSHARARAYARVSRRRECSRMFAVTAARKLPKLRVLRVRTRVRACGIPTRPRQERVKAGGLSDVSDSLDAGAARQVREESASPIRQSRSQVTACRTAFFISALWKADIPPCSGAFQRCLSNWLVGLGAQVDLRSVRSRNALPPLRAKLCEHLPLLSGRHENAGLARFLDQYAGRNLDLLLVPTKPVQRHRRSISLGGRHCADRRRDRGKVDRLIGFGLSLGSKCDDNPVRLRPIDQLARTTVRQYAGSDDCGPRFIVPASIRRSVIFRELDELRSCHISCQGSVELVQLVGKTASNCETSIGLRKIVSSNFRPKGGSRIGSLCAPMPALDQLFRRKCD